MVKRISRSNGHPAGVTMRDVAEALREHMQHLLLYGYREADEPPPGNFLDGRVDGLIILAPHDRDSLPQKIAGLGFPLAVVGGTAPPGEMSFAADADNAL